MSTIAGEVPPKFAGHETFTLRYGWLKKAVDATREQQDIFLQDDALVRLGVGKNMVRSIRHWGLVTGILEESRDVPNNRGRSYPSIRSRRRCSSVRMASIPISKKSVPSGSSTGNWPESPMAQQRGSGSSITFPNLSSPRRNCSRISVALADQAGWKRVADNSLRRDIDCFLRTYVPSKTSRTVVLEETLDCPLAELGLIQELEANHVYGFARGEHASLPLPVFAYALLTYWERTAAQRNAFTFDEVAYRPGSPGRVFKLSEDALSVYLDGMETCTKGAISYGVTAGLRQLYRRNDCSALDVLRTHYARGRKHNHDRKTWATSVPSLPVSPGRSTFEQDLWQPESLQGYLVTAGARRALLRIAPAPTHARGGPGMDADRTVRHREVGSGELHCQAPGQ